MLDLSENATDPVNPVGADEEVGGNLQKKMGFFLLFVFATFLLSAAGYREDHSFRAKEIFKRINGFPLHPTDLRLPEMTSLLERGMPHEAARIATDDPLFLRTTLRHVIAPLTNKDESHFGEFNDMEALILGVANQDEDARTLMTGNFYYVGKSTLINVTAYSPNNNLHFKRLFESESDLGKALVKLQPQRADLSDPAGILTTRAFAEAFYSMGTNRRAVEFVFRNFLCMPIQSWRDSSLSDFRVRRDVDRAPGGNPATFQQLCKSCHAPMDAMVGAFNRVDFRPLADSRNPSVSSGRLFFHGARGISDKVNQNSAVYPDGFVSTDDSWVNLLDGKTAFGWNRNILAGRGLNSFGKMISEAKAYADCWAYRSIREVCRQDPPLSSPFVQEVSKVLVSKGYKLKDAFAAAVTHPECWR